MSGGYCAYEGHFKEYFAKIVILVFKVDIGIFL